MSIVSYTIWFNYKTNKTARNVIIDLHIVDAPAVVVISFFSVGLLSVLVVVVVDVVVDVRVSEPRYDNIYIVYTLNADMDQRPKSPKTQNPTLSQKGWFKKINNQNRI